VAVAIGMYNNKHHAAFDYQFTHIEVQSRPAIEEHFIRKNLNKLEEINKLQEKAGFFSYQPGDILLIHLDGGKKNLFADKRRTFNKLFFFIRYENENVLCFLLMKDQEGKLIKYTREIEVPIYDIKLLVPYNKEIPPKYLSLIPVPLQLFTTTKNTTKNTAKKPIRKPFRKPFRGSLNTISFAG
jgi:hypothetical protein